ncbi:MAG: tRNA (adenosine(37)-N6)-threonylcarbamoyltransferase complex ATPase subunit type 1 TsaE [Ignavibacteriae bacterium]|nr:tRNA (adenosine(37)-N6)-threonylcarbamoyltransferase complex ATPase subunit type 1 TsaE [Ignavibacteriota bacterium]
MKLGKFTTKSQQETFDLGVRFAAELKPGNVVALFGDLGAGKTEFIKGICSYFNVDELVNSPTFTIMNQYVGELNEMEIPILHIDLYRIKKSSELKEIGFDEIIFSNDSVKLVEWADKAFGILPPDTYSVNIKFKKNNENERNISID